MPVDDAGLPSGGSGGRGAKVGASVGERVGARGGAKLGGGKLGAGGAEKLGAGAGKLGAGGAEKVAGALGGGTGAVAGVVDARWKGFAVEGAGNGLGDWGDDETVTLADACPAGTRPASKPQAKHMAPSQARPQLGQRCTVTGPA